MIISSSDPNYRQPTPASRVTVMKKVVLVIALAALGLAAGSASATLDIHLPEHYWVMTLTTGAAPDGVTRFGPFLTKKACKAAIPTYEKQQHGYNGRCDPNDKQPLK